MAEPTQVSATISAATKQQLDRFTENSGLRKNFVIEQALLFFMNARRELPDEALVSRRLVLENRAFDALAKSLRKTAHPPQALRDLMRGTD